MVIGGLQKLTLLDYPSKVACTIFAHGCNFLCPFCHNASLVIEKPDSAISEEEIFSFLKKRVGVLDGVCLTGGEPLLQKDVADFLKKVKALGYSVKLDTNGSFPDKLALLIEENLVDYVAMDVKNCFDRYVFTAGIAADVKKIEKSIDLLKSGKVDYEFRTTIIKGHHDEESVALMAETLTGAKRYFLQNFVDSGFLIGKAEGVSEENMRKFLAIAKRFVPNTELRGI